MGVFHGYQIAVEIASCVSVKKKQELRKLITSNDGVVSFIVTKKSKLLVTLSDEEKAKESFKCRTAVKYNIPVVPVEYIYDCVNEGRLVDTDQYVLIGNTKNRLLTSGVIASSQSQSSKSDRTSNKKSLSLNIKSIKAWGHAEKNAPAFPEDDFELARAIQLVKPAKNLFYVIEIHVAVGMEKDDDGYKFRVFTHQGDLTQASLSDLDVDVGKKECRYGNTADQVIAIYSKICQSQTDHPNGFVKSREFLGRNVGSKKFRQMQMELLINTRAPGDEVSRLIEHLWREATGELDDVLSSSCVDRTTVEQIEKAESVLLEMKKTLDDETMEKNSRDDKLQELSDDFYSHLTHDLKHKLPINSKTMIAKKQELCQLLFDMVSISEGTGWSKRCPTESKYRALRCHIRSLDADGSEYSTIKEMVVESVKKGEVAINVDAIFEVSRSVEEANFNSKLGQKKLLFHSSRVHNFVGILSRGLLLPKVIVDDFGGTRTDAGMLGSGIYFGDDAGTSAKYSYPSKSKGSRFMFVNEVSLGRCVDLYEHNTELLRPPDGYDSTHGVKANDSVKSEFKDDEFVVYDTSQQKMRYLVEFRLSDDTRNIERDEKEDNDVEKDIFNSAPATEIESVNLNDVQNISDPLLKVQAGLVSGSDAPVPLKAVHVRAKLLDLAAQVIVMQQYRNENNSPIEAKYVFPLDEMAAVCGFEAFINDKHIIGEVKEKETAHREYKEAISQGHGAYLMDQDVETPDVFTISVGNLPPKCSVLIKITYVAELQMEGERICFRVPACVAPWKKASGLDAVTQEDVDVVKVEDDQIETSVHVAIEMPFDIKQIECPTHRIRMKKTATKAVVEMRKNQTIDDGFQLLISLAEIHVPRMWVERHPDNPDSRACMLTFYPEFQASGRDGFEVVFLLDLSNSMKGSSLNDAKKVLLLALNHLSETCTFNVVVFGTDYDELFPFSRIKTTETVGLATEFIKKQDAILGNTDVIRLLNSYFLLNPEDSFRNIFLVSDGHVADREATLAAIRKNAQHSRLFAFGIGSVTNQHALRSLALNGGGYYESFNSKAKSKWEVKVKNQLSKASQPSLASISVDWQNFNDVETPVQAPARIMALFNGCRQVVYGFVPDCTQATLKAVIDNQEVSTMVSTADLNITTGKILHQLTARAVIQDWNDGQLSADRLEHEILKKNRKNYVIKLSVEFSIITQFTSFVAIEKREKEEIEKTDSEDWDPEKTESQMRKIVDDEAVDVLDYMGWQDMRCRVIIKENDEIDDSGFSLDADLSDTVDSVLSQIAEKTSSPRDRLRLLLSSVSEFSIALVDPPYLPSDSILWDHGIEDGSIVYFRKAFTGFEALFDSEYGDSSGSDDDDDDYDELGEDNALCMNANYSMDCFSTVEDASCLFDAEAFGDVAEEEEEECDELSPISDDFPIRRGLRGPPSDTPAMPSMSPSYVPTAPSYSPTSPSYTSTAKSGHALTSLRYVPTARSYMSDINPTALHGEGAMMEQGRDVEESDEKFEGGRRMMMHAKMNTHAITNIVQRKVTKSYGMTGEDYSWNVETDEYEDETEGVLEQLENASLETIVDEPLQLSLDTMMLADVGGIAEDLAQETKRQEQAVTGVVDSNVHGVQNYLNAGTAQSWYMSPEPTPSQTSQSMLSNLKRMTIDMGQDTEGPARLNQMPCKLDQRTAGYLAKANRLLSDVSQRSFHSALLIDRAVPSDKDNVEQLGADRWLDKSASDAGEVERVQQERVVGSGRGTTTRGGGAVRHRRIVYMSESAADSGEEEEETGGMLATDEEERMIRKSGSIASEVATKFGSSLGLTESSVTLDGGENEILEGSGQLDASEGRALSRELDASLQQRSSDHVIPCSAEFESEKSVSRSQHLRETYNCAFYTFPRGKSALAPPLLASALAPPELDDVSVGAKSLATVPVLGSVMKSDSLELSGTPIASSFGASFATSTTFGSSAFHSAPAPADLFGAFGTGETFFGAKLASGTQFGSSALPSAPASTAFGAFGFGGSSGAPPASGALFGSSALPSAPAPTVFGTFGIGGSSRAPPASGALFGSSALPSAPAPTAFAASSAFGFGGSSRAPPALYNLFGSSALSGSSVPPVLAAAFGTGGSFRPPPPSASNLFHIPSSKMFVAPPPPSHPSSHPPPPPPAYPPPPSHPFSHPPPPPPPPPHPSSHPHPPPPPPSHPSASFQSLTLSAVDDYAAAARSSQVDIAGPDLLSRSFRRRVSRDSAVRFASDSTVESPPPDRPPFQPPAFSIQGLLSEVRQHGKITDESEGVAAAAAVKSSYSVFNAKSSIAKSATVDRPNIPHLYSLSSAPAAALDLSSGYAPALPDDSNRPPGDEFVQKKVRAKSFKKRVPETTTDLISPSEEGVASPMMYDSESRQEPQQQRGLRMPMTNENCIVAADVAAHSAVFKSLPQQPAVVDSLADEPISFAISRSLPKQQTVVDAVTEGTISSATSGRFLSKLADGGSTSSGRAAYSTSSSSSAASMKEEKKLSITGQSDEAPAVSSALTESVQYNSSVSVPERRRHNYPGLLPVGSKSQQQHQMFLSASRRGLAYPGIQRPMLTGLRSITDLSSVDMKQQSKETTPELLLLDVTPLSIGVETWGGVMTTVVGRNTTVPTKKSVSLTTCADGQTTVLVKAYEGEHLLAERNYLLGQLRLDGVGGVHPKIEATVDIDANGIINMSIVDEGTGQSKTLSVSNQKDRLISEEIVLMVRDAEANLEEETKIVETYKLKKYDGSVWEDVCLYEDAQDREYKDSLCISRGNVKWNDDDYDTLLKMKHLDSESSECFWDLDDEFGRVLLIDSKKCRELLLMNGLKSLGEKAAENITRLIATLLLVFRIYELNADQTYVSSLKIEDLIYAVELMPVEDEYYAVLNGVVCYCTNMVKKYPLACSQLGLGRSWCDAARNLLQRK